MNRLKLSKVLATLLFSSSCVLNGTTLNDAVENLMIVNPEVEAIKQNNEAYKTYIEEANGNYKPVVDLEVTADTKKTKSKLDGTGSWTEESQEGLDGQLNFDQLIYDGGLTPALVEESKYRYESNMLTNSAAVEKVVLSGVTAYLDLVKYDKRLEISKKNVKIHETYLETAREAEKISGDTLNTVEVTARLHLAKKNYIEELDNEQIAQNSFRRVVGEEIKDTVCAPVANESVLPSEIDTFINDVLAKNNTVLAQRAKIQEQRAIINQEQSKYLPTLKFNLNGTWDDDYITSNTQKKIYSASIILNYNFYTGGKDEQSNLREKLFLKESTKVLGSKSDLVVDEATSAYNSYKISKDKIQELQGYVTANEDLLKIYKDQFEAGNRTFVDVLDIESDLYDAKVQLIDEEARLLNLYYTMLSLTSNLQDTIVAQPNIPCSVTKASTNDDKLENKEDELSDLQKSLE